MSSTKVVPNGEKADVMDALTRYYAATNVAMLLPKEPEAIKEAITDFCAVTDEKKKRVARTLAARTVKKAPSASHSPSGAEHSPPL